MVLMHDVIDRIKQVLKVTSDADVARALSVDPQNIVNWRKRGTIPWSELYEFASSNNVSCDWLFNGEKEPRSFPETPTDMNLLLKIIEQQNERIREQGLLLQAQGDRITEQGKRIDVVTILSSKTTTENKDLWDRINSIQAVLDANHAKMKKAAEMKDISVLG
jgi:hypothetical protein